MSSRPHSRTHSRLESHNNEALSQTNFSMLSGRSGNQTSKMHGRAKSSNTLRKSTAQNEFINKQLDPAKIEEYMYLKVTLVLI